MAKGIFVTFEGGEGSGKTTQIRLLGDWLKKKMKSRVVLTREPGGTMGAEKIRELIVKGETDRWDSMTEVLLFTAARRDHVHRVIIPSLNQGKVVVSDRFFDSTSVYQGMVGNVDETVIEFLNNQCLGGVKPDLTFLLDIDPEKSLVGGYSGVLPFPHLSEDRFEKKGLEYHRSVRQAFLDLATRLPDRFHVIEAARNQSAIHQEIVDILEPRLKPLL